MGHIEHQRKSSAQFEIVLISMTSNSPKMADKKIYAYQFLINFDWSFDLLFEYVLSNWSFKTKRCLAYQIS